MCSLQESSARFWACSILILHHRIIAPLVNSRDFCDQARIALVRGSIARNRAFDNDQLNYVYIPQSSTLAPWVNVPSRSHQMHEQFHLKELKAFNKYSSKNLVGSSWRTEINNIKGQILTACWVFAAPLLCVLSSKNNFIRKMMCQWRIKLGIFEFSFFKHFMKTGISGPKDAKFNKPKFLKESKI